MSNLLPLLIIGTHVVLLYAWKLYNEAKKSFAWFRRRHFPFMRLPVEIQTRVIRYAIRQAYRPPFEYIPSQITYTADVRNLLCVSKYIHALAVPELYTKIIWKDWEQSSSLVGTLHIHPEYMRHVRELEMILAWTPYQRASDAMPLVDKLREFPRRNADTWNDRLFTRLFVTIEPLQAQLAICLVALFVPTQLEWTYKQSVPEATTRTCPSFTTLFSSVMPLSEATIFHQIVRLRLTFFFPDNETARLLASLPNLQSLTLSGTITTEIREDVFRIILTTGHTRTNLTAWSLCGIAFTIRRDIHSELGICFLTSVGATFDCQTSVCELSHQAEHKIWHGCQDRARFDFHDDLTAPHIECPRCCVLAGQPTLTPTSSQMPPLEPHQPMTSIPDPPVWRFGLCSEHYGEIFQEGSGRNERAELDETSFFHRRLLECVRWHPYNIEPSPFEEKLPSS